MTTKQLDTPCVGICSTVYGDDVCRGCKRVSSVIIDWNKFDSVKKQAVFDQLGEMITHVVEPKIIIHNAELLREQLQFLGIRYRDDQSTFCDVYYLLRAGASQITDSKNNFGFEVHSSYRETSLVELFNIIEQEYLSLAQHKFTLQQATTCSNAQ